MTGQLVRKILVKASEAGLAMAGAAFLGPAWPILHAALSPVLDVLEKKLGGEDPVASKEAAERAADEFEKDKRLQELLRTNLLEGLKPVEERLEAGFQTLREMTLENTQALEDIKQTLGAGVELSDESVKRVADEVMRRITVMEDVRGLAVAQAHEAEPPEAWATRDELLAEADHAVEAVEQIREGLAAEALETVERARRDLAHALVETPTDIPLRLRLAYVLKSTAQADSATGDEDAADLALGEAERMFRLIINDLPADPNLKDQIASAANGLGNVLAARGRHAEAVPLYRQALSLMPDYAYAWHDLFGSLVALADAGDLRPEELDEAWAGLLRTAPGIPGLDPAYLEELRAEHYARVRPTAPAASHTTP